MSKNDPSKLRQEAGTPDCVWFDVRGNTRITPQFNGALPYGYCVIERRVATTYAKTAGLVPGRLQPKLPGICSRKMVRSPPSSPPPFLKYAHGTVRVRLHLLTGLWLPTSGSVVDRRM